MFSAYRLTSNALRVVRSPSRYIVQSLNSGQPKPFGLLVRTAHILVKPQPCLTAQNRSLVRFVRPLVRNAASKADGQQVAEKGRKAVGYWLLGCSGMVFVAVVLGVAFVGYTGLMVAVCRVLEIVLKQTGAGGVTRLTESGLSMVTWKLLGERWPQDDDEWRAEFERYQQFPEFQIKNPDMTVAEFKRIFFMEYAHRMWGRCIGAAFAVPAAVFWSRGYFDRMLKRRVLVFGALIAAQGLMGWYMVKSGLENRFHAPEDVPRVSQYRLASHLTLAFLLYAGFLWAALDKLVPANGLAQITRATAQFRRLAHATKGMVFLTALTGAFVAGLDAGLVYNTFPKMADRWVPSDLLAYTPTVRNFTENPTTVQFDHRIMGIVTLTMITALYWLSLRRQLPRRAYYAATAVGVMGWAQVLLGVTTLLTHVPVPLAASHQSGSLLLLSTTIWLTHELKLLKYVPK